MKRRMTTYDEMTNDDFDRLLMEIMDESPASALLTIPGIYEIIAEYFNNEVLERWERERDANLLLNYYDQG